MERMHPPRWRVNAWRSYRPEIGWRVRYALYRPDHECPTWYLHLSWRHWEACVEVPSREFA